MSTNLPVTGDGNRGGLCDVSAIRNLIHQVLLKKRQENHNNEREQGHRLAGYREMEFKPFSDEQQNEARFLKGLFNPFAGIPA